MNALQTHRKKKDARDSNKKEKDARSVTEAYIQANWIWSIFNYTGTIGSKLEFC